MPELRIFEAGNVAVRDGDSDGRSVSGYAYLWGQLSRGGTLETGGRREGFERGAFAEAIAARGDRLWPYLSAHQKNGGRPIGGIRFAEDDKGLRYEGRLMDNEAAREYAAAVNEAGQDEVSLELLLDPSSMKRKGDSIIHGKVARIAALAGVAFAAHEGATVAIRQEEHMETEVEIPVQGGTVQAGVVPLTREETAALAQRAAEDAARGFFERMAEATGGKAPDKYEKYHNLGELILAARDGDIENSYLLDLAQRALDDVVTTGGVNAALLTGNLNVRNVVGIVNRGRPSITAFGGPRPIGAVGLNVTWPYFDGTLTDYVGAQSAQKAAITGAPVDIKLGTEALVTYAGGADIAYQLIKRGDPSILEIFGEIMLAAWALVTNAAFVTELESGSVTSDIGALGSVTFASLVTNIVATSVAVQTATGRPAEFILASTTAFSKYADLIAAADTGLVVSGGATLRELSLNIGGLPIIHEPSMTAGKHIISNSLAAQWFEDGPFQVSAEDVEKLGRNVAYWSMGAGARFIPAGIIEVYDVP